MPRADAAEVYEAIGRINELLIEALGIVLAQAVGPLRVGELHAALRVAQLSAQDHQMAAEVMLTRELAETFPDGSEAGAVLTPRQVMYLASLAYGNEGRERPGDLPDPRECVGFRADGEKCQSYAMRFTHRAVCYSHATPAERERNRKAKEQWNLDHPDYLI